MINVFCIWDGKEKRILLQANTQNMGKTGSKFLILGSEFILAMLFPVQLFFFFSKGLDSKYFGFVYHMVSVATPQLCFCSMKAAVDCM